MADRPSLLKRAGAQAVFGIPGSYVSRNDSDYVLGQRLRNAGAGAASGAGTGAAIGSFVPGVGTAIGAGVGALIGGAAGFFLTDAEKEEMIGAYRRGELDDATIQNIQGTIARRYNILRRQQGADLSRRGVGRSSFAARQIADTYNAERGALAEAITGEAQQRQAIGLQLSNQSEAQRAGAVQSGIGALFQGYQLHNENQLAQQEMAADERLAAAIGKMFQSGSSGTTTPALTQNAPSIYKSQGGAGGVFSRQRTRAPGAKNPFLPSGQTLDEIFGRVR